MAFVWDTIGPVLMQVTSVPDPTNDTTPSYTLNADSVGWLVGSTGTIDYGIGAGGVGDLAIVLNGDNTTTYTTPLVDANYTDCDIIVTDFAGNVSNTLEVNDFEVDTIAAMIASVTTEDLDENGSIDTATLVFDDEINDSTIILSDFAIDGVSPQLLDTDVPNDDTVIFTWLIEIAGTDAKTLDYTSSADDLAGNDIAAFSELSVDAAGPVLLSPRTVTTTSVEATFSEDIDGTTLNGSGSEFEVDGFVISDASET